MQLHLYERKAYNFYNDGMILWTATMIIQGAPVLMGKSARDDSTHKNKKVHVHIQPTLEIEGAKHTSKFYYSLIRVVWTVASWFTYSVG